MKGVILSINSSARIVDITHEIPPQDIQGGAFALLAAYRSFPAGTVHVAVVDPGVGSSRKAIITNAADQFFVGPDNGIFSYICDRETGCRVFHIINEQYFNHPVSATFHGRDVFAPVAAALSAGVKPERIATRIEDNVRLEPLAPKPLKAGEMKARIIHIDHFGNCVTNLTQRELTPQMIESGARLDVNGRSITSFRRFFAEQKGKQKLFAVWGSAGFLEISARNQSAAEILKARRGQTVIVNVKRA
jgi:S-adenosyl-L-methionine hydrolase (adenosine-forming)